MCTKIEDTKHRTVGGKMKLRIFRQCLALSNRDVLWKAWASYPNR